MKGRAQLDRSGQNTADIQRIEERRASRCSSWGRPPSSLTTLFGNAVDLPCAACQRNKRVDAVPPFGTSPLSGERRRELLCQRCERPKSRHTAFQAAIISPWPWCGSGRRKDGEGGAAGTDSCPVRESITKSGSSSGRSRQGFGRSVLEAYAAGSESQGTRRVSDRGRDRRRTRDAELEPCREVSQRALDRGRVRSSSRGRHLHRTTPQRPIFATRSERGSHRVPKGNGTGSTFVRRRIPAIRLFQDAEGWTPRTATRNRSELSAVCLFPRSSLPPRRLSAEPCPRHPARHRRDDDSDSVRLRRALPYARTILRVPALAMGTPGWPTRSRLSPAAPPNLDTGSRARGRDGPTRQIESETAPSFSSWLPIGIRDRERWRCYSAR